MKGRWGHLTPRRRGCRVRRRRFLGFAAVVIAWPLSVYGQAKVWRIGMLETISPSQNAGNLKALRDGLRELGYVENENLLIEYRSANGQIDRLPILADELVRLPADLIITRGTPAVLAAKQATSTIPIVMAAIAEPLIAVASLAHPGANVTGFTALLTELQPKRIGITKELLPGMQRIGILLDRRNPIAPAALKDMAAAAQSLGSEVDFFDVRAADDLDRAFAVATERHDAAIIVSVEAVLQANVHLIGTLAVKHGLPTMAGRESSSMLDV